MKKIFTLLMFLWSTSTSLAAPAPIGTRVDSDLAVAGTLFLKDGSPLVSSNGLMKNQGEWSAQKAYSAGDVVQYQGGSYVAIAANSSLPSETLYWSVFVVPSNPYANIVSNTCNSTQIQEAGEGKCHCPAAPTGYKALAIQGGVGCGPIDGPNVIPSLETVAMMDDWYGGYCFYFALGDQGVHFITEGLPKTIMVKCIYVPT